MACDSARAFLTIVVVASLCSTGALARQQPSTGKYQVVKVCSLLTLAELKKLAPWPPYMEPFAKVEEEPIGPDGSSCNYPTAHVQVMSFRQLVLIR